jgi:hypothetical protein
VSGVLDRDAGKHSRARPHPRAHAAKPQASSQRSAITHPNSSAR